jgi:type IV secretion system protein VirB4
VRSSLYPRERLIDNYLPLVHHVADDVILLDDGGIFALFKLLGFPWQTKDLATVQNRQLALNTLYRNIAHPSVVIHEYRTRSAATFSVYPKGKFRSAFAADLDAAYQRKLFDDLLYDNSIFLGIEIRAPKPGGEFVSGQTRRWRKPAAEVPEERMERMANITRLLGFGLAGYRPVRLGIRDGRFSEIAETIAFAMTGQHRQIGLTTGRLGQAMFSEYIKVGAETIKYLGPGREWFAASFGMRHYPAKTWPPGTFDRLLAVLYYYTLYQSFRFVPTYDAQGIMRRKRMAMVVGKDSAKSQALALEDAADHLGSSEFVMGDHCLTMVAFADTLPALQEVATAAWSDLSSCGATIAREGLALEAALFSLCPGNAYLRPRPGYISSMNMTSFSPLHGFPTGEDQGYWGDPTAIFRTASGEPYRFHLHVNDVGNVLICGMVGSGKSVLLAYLLAQVERFGATIVAWDKDRGLKILIRALGGTYLELGNPTGLAPLKRLLATPEDIDFLVNLLRGCILADGGDQLTPDEDRRLDLGVRMVLALPPEQRWIEEVRGFLGVDADGAGARLEKWCHGKELGWIIDNEVDLISLDAPALGFDQTLILDNEQARGPVMATLYHYVDKLIDGRRLVFAIDEFWKSLLDESFSALVNDKLKTLRKQNAPMLLVTQSPRDALQSTIAHTLREQTPTKIFFNCGQSLWEDFGPQGMGLTETEFSIIRGLALGAGEFLIKQGDHSTKAQLPLQGLDDAMAVLSGRERTVRIFDQVDERIQAFHTARRLKETA